MYYLWLGWDSTELLNCAFFISIFLFQSITFLAILKIPYCDNFTDAIGLILPNSWVVYSIVLFYSIFHITSYFMKKNAMKYITLFFSMMLYIKIMAKYILGEYWHITSLAFFSGTFINLLIRNETWGKIVYLGAV